MELTKLGWTVSRCRINQIMKEQGLVLKAESMFKTIKTEFINRTNSPSHQVLHLTLFDFVHWFNNIQIYGLLNYLTPVE